MRTARSFLNLVCAVPLLASAQLDSTALQYLPDPGSGKDTGKVIFSFANTNFLKNNEYFWKIAIGYTYFGSQFNPQIAWVPNNYLRLQGGIYFRRDFGTQNIQDMQATYTLKLHKNGFSLLMGTLEGHMNHRLIEPIYNYERAITHPVENGLQFKINKWRLWMDTWINWEQQEYFGSPFQEHISAGNSTRVSVYENGRFRVVLPMQAFVFHKGGQIDSDTTSILSLANSAAGLGFEYDIGDGFLQSIRNENYITGYKDISPAKRQPYISGSGLYLNLQLRLKYGISILGSYWQGSYYIAPRGGFLYQSISSIPGSIYTEDERRLVLLRLLFQRQIVPGLYADVRYEPYFDLGNGFFDEFSYSVYLTYKKDFTLTTLKPRPLD